MTRQSRTDLLTTVETYNLDDACRVIGKAFSEPPYLVGTAADGSAGTYRDVDVRLILDDARVRGGLPGPGAVGVLCLAIGAYLSERTGLPIDFQIESHDRGE